MPPGTTAYPAALDSNNSLLLAVNRLQKAVGTGGVTSSATTIPMDDTTGAPTAGVAWIDDEAISYTGKTTTSLTGVSRGFDNTIQAAHSAGAAVYFDILIAAHHNVLKDAVVAVETKLGTGADTPALNEFLIGTAAGASGWSALTNALVLAALGYTPVNKAGDQMTGDLEVSKNLGGVYLTAPGASLNEKKWRIVANTDGMLYVQTLDDSAGSPLTLMRFDRTGVTPAGLWVNSALAVQSLAGTGTRAMEADASGNLVATRSLGPVLLVNEALSGTTYTRDGIFTSAYRNYTIFMSFNNTTNNVFTDFQLRASGANQAGANYFTEAVYAVNTATGAFSAAINGGSAWRLAWAAGAGQNLGNAVRFDIMAPQLSAVTTSGVAQYGCHRAGSDAIGLHAGTTLNTNLGTSDGFRVFVSAGNFSDGTIQIYGWG